MQRIAQGSRELVLAFMEACDYTMHADGGTELVTAEEWNAAHADRPYSQVDDDVVVLTVKDGWERYRKTIVEMQTAFQYFRKGWRARG